MNQPIEESTKRDFLLGRLPNESPERRRIEQRLVLDPEFGAEMDAAEDDLVDDYVRKVLSAGERADFERHFLIARGRSESAGGVSGKRVSSERRQKLNFALAFNRRVPPPPLPKPSWWSLLLAKLSWPSIPVYMKAAALAVVVLAVGLFAWRAFRPTPTDEGLAALGAAFERARPVEVRVTGLGYAQFAELRGPEDMQVDRQSLDLARTLLLQAPRDEPSSKHALGRLYLYERRFDDAVGLLEAAARTDPDNAQLLNDLGAALLERGKEAHSRQEEGKAAEDFARGLTPLDRALTLDPTLSDALFNRALLYENLLLDVKAEEAWRAYLAKDSSSPWAEEARRRLARLEEKRRRSAVEHEERFREFAAAYRAGDVERAWGPLGRSRGRRGNLIIERLLDAQLGRGGAGEILDGSDVLRMLAFAGRVEAEKSGDRFTSDLARFYGGASPEQLRGVARGRDLMGAAFESFYKRSEMDEALERYAAARREFEQAGDHCEALLAEQWEGICNLRIPDHSKGTATFKRLAETAQASGYTALLAQSLHGLCDASGSADEDSLAREYVDLAHKLSLKIGHAENVVRCIQFYTSLHKRYGRQTESLAMSFRGLSLALEAAPDPKLTWPLYAEAGSIFTDMGLYGAALAFQQEALRLAGESEWPLLIQRSYALLGQLSMRMRDFAEAVRVATLAVEQGKRIAPGRGRDNVVANALLQLGHVYRETGENARAVESYEQALRLYAGLGLRVYDLDARRGKLLAYEGLGDDAAAERELEALLERLEEYRSKILEVRSRDGFFDAGQSIYDAAADFAHTRRNDPRAAFEFAERSHARTLLDLLRTNAETVDGFSGQDVKLTLTTEPLGLEEIQRRMPERAQILQYHVLDDKLLVWLVSRDLFESRAVPVKRGVLDSKVKAYFKLVSEGGDADATTAAAKELYGLLIAPFEAALADDRQLCIVADKSLHELPFASLVSPASGHFLFEEHTLVHAPSASVFVVVSEAARAKPHGAAETLLAVGDPDFDRGEFDKLPPLPSAEREAREVAALYGARPLLGTHASEEEVTRGMHDADVIQLASHYVRDDGSPMRSRLLLAHQRREAAGGAGDGVLQTFEVYKMKLPRARLVVLSACQTGGDRVYRGEGAVGIARPFIAAGAPLVIASLWPAESGPTADLMVSFHRHRKHGGLPSAEAFRRAQLDMLRGPDPRNHQPRHWAAFTVTGGYADF